MWDATSLLRAGRYAQATPAFEALSKSALVAREFQIAARALGNLGGCRLALCQYRPALAAFQEARRLAVRVGDRAVAAKAAASIAAVYMATGEVDRAADWLTGAVAQFPSRALTSELPKLQIQLATLRAGQGRMPEALALFRQGIDGADRAGDWDLYAIGWNRIGEELLKRSDLPGAEGPLLEAYRVRKLHRLALETSYRNLGRLRLEQGDIASASALLDRAIDLSAQPGEPLPAWDLYHYRGCVRLRQGRLRDALTDLRTAVRLARTWRQSVPPEDASRIGAEGWIEDVHAALIEAGNRLYWKTHDAALARETFAAAEENRANSLRALLPDAAAQRPLEDLLARTRAALDGDTALLSFQLGEQASWLWAVDRGGLALYRLPPRREIEPRVSAAALAIRDDSRNAIPAGAALYGTLFRPLARRFRNKRRWLLALDPGLIEMPVAALAEQSRGPVYLAQSHVLEIIPGAAWWLDARSRPRDFPRVFVGIGDPVYNTADPRLPRRPEPLLAGIALFPRPAPLAPRVLLPRLVSSASELEACARAWGGDRILLEGLQASRKNAAAELQANPAVAHFAAHFVASPRDPANESIALTMGHGGEPELLAAPEIARWHIHAGLVVLSGCDSARGPALPGTGLLGLTRAFLAAGARSVAASRYPTPDDDGALFCVFYRKLSAGAAPPAALQAAQVQMIQSGGWRARPRYWGAYFLVGSQ